MPELPEVETVKNSLKKQILNKKIKYAKVYYDNIVNNKEMFENNLKDNIIEDITRRGKWIIFKLSDYYLLSHLRMEGKYFIKDKNEELSKHDHVVIGFNDDKELRYNDTRKFGRMILLKSLDDSVILKELGLEPFDENLTVQYLKDKLKNKKLPIKTVLLDQSIIVGIGNIYVDEILFLSKINPLKSAKDLDNNDLENIIKNTKKILRDAINLGGTTIKSYSASGVHGRFQQELLVHTKKICPLCKSDILKIRVGGRGTYYCPNCQKANK